jgi:hypothetical protein
MADKNIYIESDYNNIFIINPNKVFGVDGKVEDRNVAHEELIMYANLECDLQPRSRLISGSDSTNIRQIGASSINFLKPNNQDYLTTNWTKSQLDVNDINVVNGELLGITAINFKVSNSQVPVVTVSLEDSKGRALFEAGNESIYSAFFNLPYPTFYLTLKGYYGKAVRYPLLLTKFASSFNSSTSNFEITLNFTGFQFGVLNDINLGEILALPQMYVERTTENSGGQTTNLPNPFKTTTSKFSQKGYEKIVQVYKEYKSKGLISSDFPELTINQLITTLDNFVATKLKSFGSISMSILNDIPTYKDVIDSFRKDVLTAVTPQSWVNKYLDLTNPYYYVIESANGAQYNEEIPVYTFKNTVKDEEKITAYAELVAIFTKYSLKLSEIKTFSIGKYTIINDVNVLSISKLDVNPQTFIDYAQLTFEKRNGGVKPTQDQLETIINEIKNLFPSGNEEEDNIPKVTLNGIANNVVGSQTSNQSTPTPPLFFSWEGPKEFNEKISNLETKLSEREEEIQDDVSEKLTDILKSSNGIGFSPTIRNIIAVIMASCEGFLRLMNEVHENAFKERDNSQKKQGVPLDIKGQSFPVYPWPQFAVEYVDKKGNKKVEQQYPGDPKYIKQSNGNDYKVWPEIEFVEEFVKGFIQRSFPPVGLQKKTNLDLVTRILISGFETPSNNNPYSNVILTNFIMEYAERLRLISQYNNFIDTNDENLLNYLSASEAKNFLEGVISNSIEIPNFFKNNQINTITILEDLLKSKFGESNPKYLNYIYGNIVTEYLASEINNTFDIYNKDLPIVSTEIPEESVIQKYIESKKNNLILPTVTYPFVIPDWNKVNLSNGKENFDADKVFNTNKSLAYNKNIKKIANYVNPTVVGSFGDKKSNRPFTNFKSFRNLIDITNVTNLETFYDNRKTYEVFTEGQVTNLRSLFKSKQTTSILNTPYFINALQEGVENERQELNYAYKKASYLFINSLPLSTLREKYRNDDGTTGIDLDYIASTFRKFGAVHTLPKLWIIKIGSIWSRYKYWIENNKTDYMSSVFTDFNANLNYDPINSDPTKQYEIDGVYYGSAYTFTLQRIQTNQLNATTAVTQNVGFYPKLINDFNYFINGSNIYQDNSTIEDNINTKVSFGKLILKNTNSSNLVANDPVNEGIVDFKGWSILIENETKSTPLKKYYTPVPSYGTVVSQIVNESLIPGTPSTVRSQFDFVNNPAIFNGSVRLLWGAPNYGYFDTKSYKINQPNEYLKKVKDDEVYQNPFDLLASGGTDSYSSIEEIFTVFTKEELDIFEGYFNVFSQSSKKTTDEITFQKIMINALSVDLNFNADTLTDSGRQIAQIQTDQLKNFVNTISSNINYDLIIKKGNTENFSYKDFSIFSNTPLKYSNDNIETYINNSVPTSANTITLETSQENENKAWEALELYVGFSNINGFKYSDSGSYITDFFPDFNIGFTEENIKRFSGIIKIYATQKYKGETPTSFRTIISNNLESKDILANNLIQKIDLKLKKELPSYSEGGNYKSKRDVTEGMQSKFEYYDMFKALNDKWVAGNDYNDKLLFEDFLFLDRANRDVGNDIYVDVFGIKDYLKNASPEANLYTIIESIARNANFVPFMMPSYINFYNIQRVGTTPRPYNPDEFANSLFGTYTTVDYQDSRTKYLFQYSDEPSTHLDVQDTNYGYNDDGIYLDRPGNNTLLVDDGKKTETEKALSNKVCGFAIDFGLQNQSVFEGIQVGQDIGQPTSESLKAEYDMANLANGTSTTTQSVSLYNLYKQRSYSSTISCMGNAMIQPTMFFALRGVPLFAGTYQIQEVSHVVTPDSFKTTFSGVRVKTTTFPTIDNVLQSINKQIISNIKSQTSQEQSLQTLPNTNTITNNASTAVNVAGNKPVSSIQTCKPTPTSYSKFPLINPNETVSTKEEIISGMTQLNISKVRQEIIYNLFAIGSWNGNAFKGIWFNYAEVSLDVPTKFGGNLKDYLFNGYLCVVNKKNEQVPIAIFKNLEDSIKFSDSKYVNPFLQVIGDNFGDAQSLANKFVEAYIKYFPYDKFVKDSDVYDKFLATYPDDVEYLRSIVRKNYNLFH